MKLLRCEKPHNFQFHETSIPSLEDGHSLLQIKRIGVCGTDIHAFEGTQPYFNYPRVLGHELAAEIVETTSDNLKVGEYVTIMPYKSCGKCVACKREKNNCCVSMQVLGVHIDGGMAEYITVPNDLIIKGQGLELDELSLVEPFAISAHAIARADLQKDDFILVVGAGPIGLGLVEFGRIIGAKVVVMDVNKERLAFCKGKLEVKHTIHIGTDDPYERLKEITNGDMPTAIFDATGNLNAIEQSLEYLAHSGTYVLVGIQKESFSLSHPEFHKRESTLMSSRNATKLDFDFVMESIKNKKINPLLFITHRIPFEEVIERFSIFNIPSENVIKAVIEL
jgi:2-desacetyl-2-hydroxyethyl bacteriochlorophyllide A dehydrogenase